MRKFYLTTVLLLAVITGFSQQIKENGTIYVRHPNIDIVIKSVKAYQANDTTANAKLFSDTARFWLSGMEKPVPISTAFKDWNTDFDFYKDIKVTMVGYPDYLHYVEKDVKTVQSWWQWSGTSKKTGEVIKVDFVQFDSFNNEGKIIFETMYGDFSKVDKN